MAYYNQALPVLRELGDRNQEATTLINIGSAHHFLKEEQKALEFYNQALSIELEIKDRRGEASARNAIGLVCDSSGEKQKALEYYNQALILWRNVGDRGGEAVTLGNIASTYLTLGAKAKAAEFYREALPVARAVGDRRVEAITLSNLMWSWKESNQPLAIFYGKQSVNVFQQLRGNIKGLEKQTQTAFLHSVEDSYRNLANLLIAQGRLPEAQQVLGLLKEEEYFDFVRRDGDEASSLKGNAALTPEEAAVEKRYREFADRLTAIGLEYGQLRDKKTRTTDEEQRLARLAGDLTIANQVFQKFLDEIDRAFSGSAAGSEKAFQLRESQGLMETLRDLGSGAVVLYTVVGEDKYRVILVTPEVQKAYEYPISATDLNRKVLAFREALQNPLVDPRPLGQELYKILIGPGLARDLSQANTQTLMWSLDGVLRYLPIAALHDGNGYLLERYRNVVFTPASQSRLKDPVSAKWKLWAWGSRKRSRDSSHFPACPKSCGNHSR